MPAAVCSLAGWSLQYYSLTLTSPSSYSILRGTVIFFTGLDSSLFLKHQMSWKKWGSLFIIFSGLVIVGTADVLQPANSNPTQISASDAPNCPVTLSFRDVNEFLSNEVIGDILVVSAQIFLSAKFVYEEKVLSCYNIKPLQVIGWEGFYGLIGMAILLLPLSLIDTGSCEWSNSPTPPWKVCYYGWFHANQKQWNFASSYVLLSFIGCYLSLFSHFGHKRIQCNNKFNCRVI